MGFRYLNDKTYQKQRGFAVAAENGGPLDVGSIYVSLPNSEQTRRISNLYIGRRIFVCDADKFYIWSLKEAYDSENPDKYINDPYTYGEWKEWISGSTDNTSYGIDFTVNGSSNYSNDYPVLVTENGNVALTAKVYGLWQGKKVYFEDAQIGYDWNTNATNVTSGNTYTFDLVSGYDKVGFLVCKAYVLINNKKAYLAQKSVKFIVFNKEKTETNISTANGRAYMHVEHNMLYMTKKVSQLQRGMSVSVSHPDDDGATNIDMTYVLSNSVYPNGLSANPADEYLPGMFPNFYQGRLVYSKADKEFYYWGRRDTNHICYIPSASNLTDEEYIRRFNTKNGVYDTTKFTWKVLPRTSDFSSNVSGYTIKGFQIALTIASNTGGASWTVYNGNLGDVPSGNYTTTATLYALLSDNVTKLKVANVTYSWADTNVDSVTRYWGLTSVAGSQQHTASATGQDGYFDFLVHDTKPTTISKVGVTASTSEGVSLTQPIIGSIIPSVSNYGCRITIDGTNPAVVDAARFIVNPNHASSENTNFHAELTYTASGEMEEIDSTALRYQWSISEPDMNGPASDTADKTNNFKDKNESTTNDRVLAVGCKIYYNGELLASGTVNVTLLRKAVYDVALTTNVGSFVVDGNDYSIGVTNGKVKPTDGTGRIDVSLIDIYNSSTTPPNFTYSWEVTEGTFASSAANASATFSRNNTDPENYLTYKCTLHSTVEGFGALPDKTVTVVINKASKFDIVLSANKIGIEEESKYGTVNYFKRNIPGGAYSINVTAELRDLNGNLTATELANNASFAWRLATNEGSVASLGASTGSEITTSYNPSTEGDKDFVIEVKGSYNNTLVRTETLSGTINKRSDLYVKFRLDSGTGTVIDSLSVSPYSGKSHTVYCELASRNNDDLTKYTITNVEWSGIEMDGVDPAPGSNGYNDHVTATCTNDSQTSIKTVGIGCVMYLTKTDAGETLEEVASAEIYGKVGLAPKYRLVVKHNGTEINDIGEIGVNETYAMTASIVDDNNVAPSSIINGASFSWLDSTGRTTPYVENPHTIANTANSSEDEVKDFTITVQANYTDPIISDELITTFSGYVKKAPKYVLQVVFNNHPVSHGNTIATVNHNSSLGLTGQVLDANNNYTVVGVPNYNTAWNTSQQPADNVRNSQGSVDSERAQFEYTFTNSAVAKTPAEQDEYTVETSITISVRMGGRTLSCTVYVDVLPIYLNLPKYTGMSFIPSYKQNSSLPDDCNISEQCDKYGKYYVGLQGSDIRLSDEYLWYTLDDRSTKYSLSESDDSRYNYMAEVYSEMRSHDTITLHVYGFWNNGSEPEEKTITRNINLVKKGDFSFTFSSPYKENESGEDIFVRQQSLGSDDDNDYYFTIDEGCNNTDLTSDIGGVIDLRNRTISTKFEDIGSPWQYKMVADGETYPIYLGARGLLNFDDGDYNLIEYSNKDISGQPFLAAYRLKAVLKDSVTLVANTTYYLSDILDVKIQRTYKMVQGDYKLSEESNFTAIRYSGTHVNTSNGTFCVTSGSSSTIDVEVDLFGKMNGSKTLTIKASVDVNIGENVEALYLTRVYETFDSQVQGKTTEITEYGIAPTDREKGSDYVYMMSDMQRVTVQAVGHNLENVGGNLKMYTNNGESYDEVPHRTLEELRRKTNEFLPGYHVANKTITNRSDGYQECNFDVYIRWYYTMDSYMTRLDTTFYFSWGGKWGYNVGPDNNRFVPCTTAWILMLRKALSMSADTSQDTEPDKTVDIKFTVNGHGLTKYPNYITVEKKGASATTYTTITPSITCTNPDDSTLDPFENSRTFKFTTDTITETTTYRITYKINDTSVWRTHTVYVVEAAPEITVYSNWHEYL